MGKNANLQAAKKAKNDEFYTQYSDIEAEMNAYYEYDNNVFRGKTILLPCDDPEWSNFTKYFVANFERFGLKKLISTSYAKSSGNKNISKFEKESPKFDVEKNKTHGKVFILEKDKNKSGRIDYEDIEFEYLEGDGDFRSEEVTRLRNEADIIITNPPFSLFREFLAWIRPKEKKFSIIGNQNAITYKEVFPLIKDEIIWLGEGFSGSVGFFSSPYEDIATSSEHKEGMIRVSGVIWLTNLELEARHKPLELMSMSDNLRYNKKLIKKLPKDENGKPYYPEYDNFPGVIEVPVTDGIPSDYDGVMGVPITMLQKFSKEQFEIVSFRKGEDGKDLAFTREREREFNHTFELLSNSNRRIDEQSKRYKNQWEEYLRKNNNKAQIEPIDFFYPATTIGCCEPCIDLEVVKTSGIQTYSSRQINRNGKICQKVYHRILIKRR